MKSMRIIAALVLLAAAAQAAAQDTLKFHDPGRPNMQGEITSMNFRIVEIEIEVGGLRVPQKVNTREIREIDIDAARKPFDFSSGEDSMNKGDYAQAAERFERARKDGRDVIKQTAGINVVRCHFNAGDAPSALAAIKTLRQEKPETYYLRETYEIEYRCHASRGDTAAAARVAEEFEKKGRSDKLDEWAKSADVMRAQLFETQGKSQQALEIYSRYARDKDVGEEASLGELRCLRGAKNWVQLKAKAEVMITSNKGKRGGERALTGAYNARGEAALQAGNAKEALLDFMQGVAVLNKGGESTREHEASLALAAVACAHMATSEKEKAKKDVYRDRARELMADLDKIYANSPWRAEVDKAIKGIH
jgi:tetratricopeptide (TPR) repeat protein